MIVRIVEAQLKTDKLDEASELYEAAMEAAQQSQGFLHGMLVADPGTGKGFSITVWESKETEEASRTSLLQEQLVKFGSVFAAAPTSGSYAMLSEG